MPFKITLCKCYFGGETCSYCGSSGVIIEENSDEKIIYTPIQKNQKLKSYLKSLKKVNENIQNNRYNRGIILNNIYKVHNSKKNNLTLHNEVSPIWMSCETEYQNIINKLNNIEYNSTIQQSELYLFDIVHYKQNFYFFSLNDQCISDTIQFIFVEGNTVKKYYKSTKDIYKFLKPRDIHTINQDVKLIATDFDKLEDKGPFKSLIIVDNTKPKIKFYYYKTNKQTGKFYFIDWDYFIETLEIKL
jgi:hypothetical protein